MGEGAARAGLVAVVQQVLVTDAKRETARRTPAGLIKLLTNAIKDTVSVLYWYEELSSFTTGNFWKSSSELFFVSCIISPPWALGQQAAKKVGVRHSGFPSHH